MENALDLVKEGKFIEGERTFPLDEYAQIMPSRQATKMPENIINTFLGGLARKLFRMAKKDL